MSKRFFSKDENILILEIAMVCVIGLLLFAGGFLVGNIISIGKFLIAIFGVGC